MTYSVYVGKEGNVVKYVGITKRDVSKRVKEHMKSGTERAKLKYSKLEGTGHLSHTQARIREQIEINKYGLNNLYNKINSISPSYWDKYGIK